MEVKNYNLGATAGHVGKEGDARGKAPSPEVRARNNAIKLCGVLQRKGVSIPFVHQAIAFPGFKPDDFKTQAVSVWHVADIEHKLNQLNSEQVLDDGRRQQGIEILKALSTKAEYDDRAVNLRQDPVSGILLIRAHLRALALRIARLLIVTLPENRSDWEHHDSQYSVRQWLQSCELGREQRHRPHGLSKRQMPSADTHPEEPVPRRRYAHVHRCDQVPENPDITSLRQLI